MIGLLIALSQTTEQNVIGLAIASIVLVPALTLTVISVFPSRRRQIRDAEVRTRQHKAHQQMELQRHRFDVRRDADRVRREIDDELR